MATTTEKRYNKVLDVIDNRLVPDKEAKKARGEVFTPLNLVREMLFGLRKSSLSKEKNEIWGMDEEGKPVEDDPDNRVGGIPLDVWRDPESTFLDPANGIGNFPVVAFYILDFQLDKHSKDPKFKGEQNKQKRRKHIVENMLYMIELNKGNVNTSRKIFRNIAPGTEPNIVCANTLSLNDDKLKKVFGINRFTVVMGNPPFQEINEKGETIGGKQKLYQKFIYPFGTSVLKDTGSYMVYVIPDNFFIGNSIKGYSDIIKKQIILLNTSDITSTYFPQIGQNTVYFLLQNIVNTKVSLILDRANKLNSIQLTDRKLNPLLFWNKVTEKIFSKLILDTDNDSTFKYVREDFKIFKNTGNYKVIIQPNLTKYTDNIEKARGWNIPKIIIFRQKPNAEPYVDYTGKTGAGPETYYYTDTNKNHLDNLNLFFMSDIFKFIKKLTTTSQYLKNPSFINLESMLVDKKLSESDIYEALDINKEEVYSVLQKIETKSKKQTRRNKAGGARFNKTRKIKRN